MEQNLRQLYPLSFRWIFLKIIPWIILLFASLYAVYIFESGLVNVSLDHMYINVFYLGAAIILLRFIYLVLFFSTITYSLKGDELYIVRGIFFKKPLGIPLSKINAIHVQRSIPEILFKLSTLVFVVPGDIPVKLLSISGFSRVNAEGLKGYLFSKN